MRVVIQDGEGFILIKKGKPLVYYFKHGRIELRGHAALDYFNSHPTIEFNLCKYTPEEFSQALKICNVERYRLPRYCGASTELSPGKTCEKQKSRYRRSAPEPEAHPCPETAPDRMLWKAPVALIHKPVSFCSSTCC